MKKKQYVIIALGLLYYSCETAPSIAPVAWMRTLTVEQQIEASSSILLNINGYSEPLSGDNKLVVQRMEDYVSDLLTRRGYSIASTEYDYKCIVTYKTSMASRVAAKTTISTYTSSRFFTSNNAISGSMVFNNTFSSSTTDLYETTVYMHNISVNILDKDNNSIWSSDSAWESSDLDILSNSYMVIKILFNGLPKANNVYAYVPSIKENRILEYFERYYNNQWFTSLALPYSIRFDSFVRVREDPSRDNSPIIYVLPKSIPNGQYLAAFIDLIVMAEVALPGGSIEDWRNNPLSNKLWDEAFLAGKYLIGNDSEPKNIIINLRKISGGNGYVVNNCKIVLDEEYNLLLDKIIQWQDIVSEYFNFYE